MIDYHIEGLIQSWYCNTGLVCTLKHPQTEHHENRNPL